MCLIQESVMLRDFIAVTSPYLAACIQLEKNSAFTVVRMCVKCVSL